MLWLNMYMRFVGNSHFMNLNTLNICAYIHTYNLWITNYSDYKDILWVDTTEHTQFKVDYIAEHVLTWCNDNAEHINPFVH